MQTRCKPGRLARFGGVLVAVAVAAVAQAQPFTDQDVADAIENELLFDQAVPANKIDVRVDDGVATLEGQVTNILASERATRLAETVRGVRSVVNRIAVAPANRRLDREVEQDVELALALDPSTESWEIDASVTGGEVVLVGTVESWQEKRLAGFVARGVRGVTSLDNRIDVQVEHERLDVEIADEVQSALRWDALVDHGLIAIDVNDGVVELSGTVGSAAEKSRAAHNAWVPGVSRVESDDLEVARWARDEDLRQDKFVVRSDDEVEAAIAHALQQDPRVVASRVTAKVDDGVVTLRGHVTNLRAKRAAEQDSKNTVGVVQVINRLKVRPSTPTDDQLREYVTNALVRDPVVERHEISVTVHDGVATLTGAVDSYYEKSHADQVVARVYGVTEVRNNLEVASDDAMLYYDPYIHAYDPSIYEWYVYEPYYTSTPDVAIEAAIENELIWSPFVDSGDVRVEVDDGVAHLTGTVESWQERLDAAENAFEGGAVWVDNDLEVK